MPQEEKENKNLESVMDAIKDSLNVLASATASNYDEAKQEIKKFVEEMKYDLNVALNTYVLFHDNTHLMTLRYLYSATILTIQQSGQKFIAKQKEAVAATIIAVLRGLIAAGFSVL